MEIDPEMRDVSLSSTCEVCGERAWWWSSTAGAQALCHNHTLNWVDYYGNHSSNGESWSQMFTAFVEANKASSDYFARQLNSGAK